MGDYSFNSSEFINEANGKPIKAYSVLLVEDRFGNAKSACFFQGTEGSYLNLGTSAELKPRETTISLWARIDRASLSGKGFLTNPFIMTKNNNKDDFFEAYAIVYNYDEERIGVASTNSELQQVHTRSSTKMPLHEWHHYVLCFDDKSLALYVDGKLDSKVPKRFQTIYSPTDSILVGNSGNAKNNRFLLGFVDDIKIYNRVLDEREIIELYNAPDPNRFRRVLRIIGIIIGALLFAATVIWIFIRRSKRKYKLQEERNQVLARMNELETRAIRMHMNPHFIFNSLNSLQRYILEADIEKAQTYLTRFSALLRQILESSNAESISLSSEMHIIKTYIEIEKVRFENSFAFEISSNISNADAIFIPFMLVQPLVENAIWHGLLPKKGDKFLSIAFTQTSEKTITCKIIDNGVGLQVNSPEDGLKKPSQGLNFIKQRLELLQKTTGTNLSLELSDVLDEAGEVMGTKVMITIPIL